MSWLGDWRPALRRLALACQTAASVGQFGASPPNNSREALRCGVEETPSGGRPRHACQGGLTGRLRNPVDALRLGSREGRQRAPAGRLEAASDIGSSDIGRETRPSAGSIGWVQLIGRKDHADRPFEPTEPRSESLRAFESLARKSRQMASQSNTGRPFWANAPAPLAEQRPYRCGSSRRHDRRRARGAELRPADGAGARRRPLDCVA